LSGSSSLDLIARNPNHTADATGLVPDMATVTRQPKHLISIEARRCCVGASDAAADPSIRDDKYNATVLGWAEYFEQSQIAERTASGRVSTRRLGPATVATKAGAQSAILDTLRERGGSIEGASVRGLASLIGAHKSNVHNALGALITAGVVAKIGTALVLRA
jgi:hypothetical protein